jgi:hypothetical protein
LCELELVNVYNNCMRRGFCVQWNQEIAHAHACAKPKQTTSTFNVAGRCFNLAETHNGSLEHSTLHGWLAMLENVGTPDYQIKGHPGPSQMMPARLEKEIVDWIVHCMDNGNPPTAQHVLTLLQNDG